MRKAPDFLIKYTNYVMETIWEDEDLTSNEKIRRMNKADHALIHYEFDDTVTIEDTMILLSNILKGAYIA